MMIDIASAIPTILTKLKKIPIDHYLDLQTFKKDRSITIIRQTEGEFQIIERGFHDDIFSVKASKLKKTIKTLLKREFPRSNKIRLYSGTSNSIKQHPPQKNNHNVTSPEKR